MLIMFGIGVALFVIGCILDSASLLGIAIGLMFMGGVMYALP